MEGGGVGGRVKQLPSLSLATHFSVKPATGYMEPSLRISERALTQVLEPWA